MSLPLQEIATEGGLCFLLTPGGQSRPSRPAQPDFIPGRLPGPGEQYRFHLDMTKCIGCRCCEVACNEQNNNPPDIHWRRVGEIEGGSYPFTHRLYLSMGCNHCLEPACLIGCPVEAYTKDPVTGIVLHSADTCIGCQYCTWNCPYGVPQYNPERGVVGKCDLCYGRLAEGREPACVNACPEGAIQVEIVNAKEWSREYAEAANSPGLPSAAHTISTTRITLPETLPAQLDKADAHRVQPEHPHWPLVFMTVLSQLSVGAFASLWLIGLAGWTRNARFAAWDALAAGLLALGGSTLHLGRPIYAYRALKMWRRSWLSREVLLFGCFSMAASANALALWFGWTRSSQAAGLLTAILGVAAVTASAFIYRVPARPAWNSGYTVAEFCLTTLIPGPLFLAVAGLNAPLFFSIAASAGIGQFLNQGLKLLWLARSDSFELRASARLLSGKLQRLLLLRFALLGLGGVLLPLYGSAIPAFVCALAGEILGRYLFFVGVVPKNMAASFLGRERRAA